MLSGLQLGLPSPKLQLVAVTWSSAAVSRIAAPRDVVAMLQIYLARNCANATIWLDAETQQAFFNVYQKDMV